MKIFNIVFILLITCVYPVESSPELTKRFEGFSETIYLDTLNNETIGYGFSVNDPLVMRLLPEWFILGEDRLPRAVSDYIFMRIYEEAKADAEKFIGRDVFYGLSANRRAVLVDLSYQLGYPGLSKFKKFKTAVIVGDFNLAAHELKNSLWYKQSGRRARHHVNVFKGGA